MNVALVDPAKHKRDGESQKLLFDLRLSIIRCESERIAEVFRGQHYYMRGLDAYNLRATEANLREAADKVAELRKLGEITQAP